jgi:hypothetical protein
MAKFLDELVYTRTGKKHGGRPVFRLTFDFRFNYGTDEYPAVVTVPAGFETDLASVPRILWSFIAPWEADEAAIIHDWLYHRRRLDRRVADSIFRQALVLCGIGRIHAALMWLGVRLFGAYWYWGKGGEEDVAANIASEAKVEAKAEAKAETEIAADVAASQDRETW